MDSKLRHLRKSIILSLICTTVIAAGVSAWYFGPLAGLISVISSLCLALGLWLTEGLVGVMTGVKKANGTAIGLLFLAKLGWWGGLFWLSKFYPPGTETAIALGMGAFLLALLIASLNHFGWPKISDGKGE